MTIATLFDFEIAHLALDLGARHERGDRVDDDDVDRVRAHERLGDLQRLLAGIRLGDEQRVHVDAERRGVHRVERVLDVDERGVAAHLLPLCDAVERERRFTGGFRPVDLDDSAARQAADAEREVERKRPGRDRLDLQRVVLAEAHDRALAKLLLDLRQRGFQRLELIFRLDPVVALNLFRDLAVLIACHIVPLPFFHCAYFLLLSRAVRPAPHRPGTRPAADCAAPSERWLSQLSLY